VARPISAATRVATQAASAADSRCAHHGALNSLARQILWACSREAPFRPRGRALRPLGLIPWQLAAIRLASGRKSAVPRRRLTASAWKSLAIMHRSLCVRGRVPRLAEERHKVALALIPCAVEGRVAAIVSECRIRAPFEKTLGDREVAVECSLMQCCVTVFLLGRGPMDHYGAAGPWHMCLGEGHARGLQSWR
jgi:hypothetical protein